MNIVKAPKFTKKTLEKHLEQYDVGRLVSYKKLEGGVANQVYKVRTKKGIFTLKIVVRNNPHRVLYEVELLNKIKNLPTPKIVKTKNGDYLTIYKNHKIMLYSYLPGQPNNKINKKKALEVGKFLGKLHLQTRKFTSKIDRVELYAINSAKINYINKNSKSITNLNIKNAISYIKEHALKYKLPTNLPNGAMHMDINSRNVLFSGENLTGVVDFDNAYNGPLALDLAGALVWFCYDKDKFDLELIKTFYRGYRGVRKLNPKEKAMLFDLMHHYILGISLHGIEFYIQNKLSEKFIMNIVVNYLLKIDKKLYTIEKDLKTMLK